MAALSLLSFMLCPAAFAQGGAFYHNDFDTPSVRSFDNPSEHCQKALVQDTYCTGISGKALDLSSDSPVRRPVMLRPADCPDYSKSFSFSAWIKTKPGARQGTPVMGNKKNFDFLPQTHKEYIHTTDDEILRGDEMKTAGWLVGTTNEGAWYFYIGDGKSPSYVYYPTAARQRINDGKWHHLSGSVDFSGKEVRLYYDGLNVAIINIEEITSAVSPLHTMIGGSDDFTENGHWEAEGEWMAFNGMLDEVKIWDRAIDPEELVAEYGRFRTPARLPKAAPKSIRVMSWNIWHGGRRFGEYVGLERVAEVMRDSKADLIGMVETYGSGAQLADALGFYYYCIGDNLAILSRFPVESTIKFYQPNRSGGVVLNLGGGRKLAFFDIWLDWREDYRKIADMNEIRKTQKLYTDNAGNIPVISVGDYNCPSHLDFTPQTRSDYDAKFVQDYPSQASVEYLGFKDSFREMNPDALSVPGWTYTIQYPESHKSWRQRIDFIYYKGDSLEPVDSYVTHEHKVYWPSDHSALVTDFKLKKK